MVIEDSMPPLTVATWPAIDPACAWLAGDIIRTMVMKIDKMVNVLMKAGTNAEKQPKRSSFFKDLHGRGMRVSPCFLYAKIHLKIQAQFFRKIISHIIFKHYNWVCNLIFENLYIYYYFTLLY